MPRPISSPATSSSRASCARSRSQALDAGDIDALAAARLGSEGKSVAEAMTQLIATIGENMTLRRMAKLEVGSGVVVGYVHNARRRAWARSACWSRWNRPATPASSPPSASSSPCMSPRPIRSPSTSARVDPAALERERNVLAEQARTSGKAEEIIAKMVEGRLRKYYEEVVLLEQVYVIDGESRVKAAVAAAAKEVGAPIAVIGLPSHGAGRGHPARAEGLRRRGRGPARELNPPRGRARRGQGPAPRSMIGCSGDLVSRERRTMANLLYTRVLLKISGEALMGDREFGLDPDTVNRIAGEVKTAVTHGRGALPRHRRRATSSAASPAPPRACSAPRPTTWACWPP